MCKQPLFILAIECTDYPAAMPRRSARETLEIPLSITLNPVELSCRTGIGLRILTSDGQAHGMPFTDVAADHTLVGNVFAHLPSEVRFDLQTLEWICVEPVPVMPS